MEKIKTYKVIRDTREQKGWTFPANSQCEGTIEQKLHTGDYTLVGYENDFVIERKYNTSELANNIVQERFKDELNRLLEFRHAFIVCEFDFQDIIDFPRRSGIPQNLWGSVRINPQFLVKRIHEFQLRYHVIFAFVGNYGREYCSSLFKRIVENVEPSNPIT